MKLILEISSEERVPFFMELIEGLKYVKVVAEIGEDTIKEYRDDIAGAFNEIKLHEEGKIKLKTAREVLDEL